MPPPQLRPENFTFDPGERIPEYVPGDPSLAQQNPKKFYLFIRTVIQPNKDSTERRESDQPVAINIDDREIGRALMLACQRRLDALPQHADTKRSALLRFPAL